jgi:hypothetical protein
VDLSCAFFEREVPMKTCRIAVLALLGVLITLASPPLSAQDTLAVKAGDRVRVTTQIESPRIDPLTGGVVGTDRSRTTHIGVLESVSQSSLSLRAEDELVVVERSEIHRVEKVVGKMRNTKEGFAMGSGVGVFSGFILGFALAKQLDQDASTVGGA